MERIRRWLERYEDLISIILIAIAALLVFTAIFGKSEHKAGLLVYVLLP